MQPVERMQQPSTFDLWLRRLWRLWHRTNASHACAEHCCLLIGQLIQFSTTPEWPGKPLRKSPVEYWRYTMKHLWNHIWWQWNASQELLTSLGASQDSSLHSLKLTWPHPWKRRWRWARKPSFLGVNSLRRLTVQYFSDVFRSCLWDLGPGSAIFGKRCATGTSILYRPAAPPSPLHVCCENLCIPAAVVAKSFAGLKCWGRWKLAWQTSEKDHRLRWQNEKEKT